MVSIFSKLSKLRFFLIAFLTLFFLGTTPSISMAQDSDNFDVVERLPAETFFYLHWKGLSSVDKHRATNPVLRLLNSDDFMAMVGAIKGYRDQLDKIRQDLDAKQDGKEKEAEDSDEKGSLENWGSVLRALQNEGLIAAIPIAAADGPGSTNAIDLEEAVIALYDTTGIQDLIDNFDAHQRSRSSEVNEYDFGGVTVTEYVTRIETEIPQDEQDEMEETEDPSNPAEPEAAVESKKDPERMFRAQVGKWMVAGDDKAVFEQFLLAVQSAPATSITSNPPHQRARSTLGEGSTLEIYLDIATILDEVTQRAANTPGAPIDPVKAIDASGFNQWESLVVGGAVKSARITFNGGLLRRDAENSSDGDMIFGPPVAEFGATALAPKDALSFGAFQLNIGALLQSIDAIIMEAAPDAQKPQIMGMKGMAMGMMGMSVEDFGAAWGPEHAQIAILDSEGESLSIHATSLDNRDGLVTAIRNLLAAFGGGNVRELPPGESADDATAFVFADSVTASFQPDWLVVAASSDAVDQFGEKQPGSSLRDNANYQRIRSGMPAELIGMDYYDANRWIDSGQLDKALASILKQMAESAEGFIQIKVRGAVEEDQKAKIPAPPMLVFPRGFLNFTYGSVSRDAKGIYFSGTME